MAIQWGAASGSFRLGIDLVGTTLIVYGQSVAYGHDWSSTLTRSGSWLGSTAFSFYSGFGATVTKEIYRQTVSASGTYTASTSYWNGSASVSRTVALGSAPGAPSGFAITRTSDTAATLAFTKGSGATTTQITASKGGAAWYNLVEPTGASVVVSGFTVDTFWRLQAYSKNAAGKSAVIGPYVMYTKPKTPTTPTLSASRLVSWSNTGRYTHGVQLAYRDATSGDGTTVELGSVTSWTDPNAQPPLRQYRVRTWAGPSHGEARTYSDWSEWSATAMGVTYKAPQITALTARRCNSAGTLTETGRYVKVTASGTVSSVKNAAGTETNKITRKAAYRKSGTTGPWISTDLVLNAAPNNWASVSNTIGGNAITEDAAWDILYTVTDAYTTTPIQQIVTVPASQVAFSVGPSGVGAGKVWEQGALDVGGDAYIAGTLHSTALEVNDVGLLRREGFGIFQKGIVSSVAIVTNNAVSGTVTFFEEYEQIPTVMATSFSGRLNVQISKTAVTKTGFTWWLRNDSGATAAAADSGFAWIAIPL